MLSIIVAISEDYAIGKQGNLLCHLPNDLRHFKAITMGSTVLMGSRTYLSLPRRPLPNRRNIVITRQSETSAFAEAEVVHSIKEALDLVVGEKEVFIIGGGSIYKQMFPMTDKLYVTHIGHRWPDADTFFPLINSAEWHLDKKIAHPADEQHSYPYTFAEYTRIKK